GLAEKSESKPAAASRAASFGEAIVEKWIDNLERKALDEELTASFGLGSDLFAVVTNELAVASRRFEVIKDIEDYVARIDAYRERPDEIVHRVSMGVSLIVNDLVNYLGTDREVAEDGEDAENSPAGDPEAFFDKQTVPKAGEPPYLAKDLEELMTWRGSYVSDWLGALYQMTRKNASWGQGGLIDIEQNQKLGSIIALIEG
ncbi:MAG: virulence factor SrfC family protein, partial [Kiloniellales bacterium]|nr:virulence factor SrfC family protein [Kiloniellales bacterium]